MSRNFRESALLGIMAAVALQENMGFVDDGNQRSTIPDFKSPKKLPPIPKGCKRYYFWENGIWFLFEEANTVYSCIALSEKRAIDKFNKKYSK